MLCGGVSVWVLLGVLLAVNWWWLLFRFCWVLVFVSFVVLVVLWLIRLVWWWLFAGDLVVVGLFVWLVNYGCLRLICGSCDFGWCLLVGFGVVVVVCYADGVAFVVNSVGHTWFDFAW